MSKRKSFVIIGIIVVIIIVLAVGWSDVKPAKAPEVSGSTATSTSAVSTSTAAGAASSTGVAPSSSMTITVQKFFSNGAFSFSYPTSWAVQAVSPFSMDDFGGKYNNGGVIPAGGAEINIATTTIGGPLSDIVDTELLGETSVTSSTVVVNGTKCEKDSGQANYGPGATSKDISIYCVRGSEVWKIYLSYPAGDAAAGKDLSDFNTILGSMKLLG